MKISLEKIGKVQQPQKKSALAASQSNRIKNMKDEKRNLFGFWLLSIH